MNEELDALHKNHTWDMIDLPPGQFVVGCRWVYKIKTKAGVSVEWYKVRLLPRALLRSMTLTMRKYLLILLALHLLDVSLLWLLFTVGPLYQMDVKNSFLDGDL